jgi:hypothetical protein
VLDALVRSEAQRLQEARYHRALVGRRVTARVLEAFDVLAREAESGQLGKSPEVLAPRGDSALTGWKLVDTRKTRTPARRSP